MGKRLKGSNCSSRNYTDYQLRQVSAQVMGMKDFDEEAFRRQVDHILILSDWQFEYHFTDRRIVSWKKCNHHTGFDQQVYRQPADEHSQA